MLVYMLLGMCAVFYVLAMLYEKVAQMVSILAACFLLVGVWKAHGVDALCGVCAIISVGLILQLKFTMQKIFSPAFQPESR